MKPPTIMSSPQLECKGVTLDRCCCENHMDRWLPIPETEHEATLVELAAHAWANHYWDEPHVVPQQVKNLWPKQT